MRQPGGSTARHVVTVTLLVAAFASPAEAQNGQSCHFDTAAVTQTVPITVGLAPGWTRAEQDSAPDDYALAAQAIQTHFVPPTSLTLPVWARTAPTDTNPWAGSDLLRFGLHGELVFRLDPSGRLADTAITIVSASPELRSSLIAAVRSADSAGEFLPPGQRVQRDSGTIVLRLVDWSRHQGPGVPLMRLTVPTIRVDVPARLRWQPGVQYPVQAFQQQRSDTIVLLHVVTALGQAEPSSFRVVAGRHRDLVLAAIEATVHSSFEPARVGGCAVPQEVLGWVPFTPRP
jgi:hypothetical protein